MRSWFKIVATAIVFALSLAWLGQKLVYADECRVDENCEVKVETLDFGGKLYWEAGAEIRGIGRLAQGDVQQFDTMARAKGEIAYDGVSCKWIALAGDIGAYRDVSGKGMTGKQKLTFCLPYPVFRPEVTMYLEQDLRPGLSAAPTVLSDRVRGGGVDLTAYAAHISATTDELRRDLRLLIMRGGTGYRAQDIDGMETRIANIRGGFAIAEAVEYGNGFLGEDRHFTLIEVDIDSRDDENDVAGNPALESTVITMPLFDLTNGRLPRTPHFFDLSVGMVVGDVIDASNPDAKIQAIHPHLIMDFFGGSAAQAAGFGYRHTIQPTNYGAIILEDRVSGWWRRGRRHDATTVRGFAALTDIIDGNGSSGRTFTGGVAVEHDMLLAKYLNVSLGAELARSFYASMDGGAGVDVGWVAQASIRTNLFVNRKDKDD